MTATTHKFGALAEPLHPDAAGPHDPPYKDNAYLAFWSAEQPVFAEVHMSTSPNAPRRARCAVSAHGHTVEIVEDCPREAFTSEHIDFGLDGHVRVHHPKLSLELSYAPRFGLMDYSPDQAIGGLVAEAPLRHYQQGVDIAADLTVDGRTISIAGTGFRDRTWGFRDESAQWAEFATLWGTFATFDVSAMKFLAPNGGTTVAGYLNSADGQQPVTEMHHTFDSSGMLHRLRLVAGDTDELVITHTGRLGGFWLPMGPPRREGEPVLMTYDEFADLNAWGHPGRAIVASGALRRIG